MWETGIELEMDVEKTATGEVTRPILLLQAELHDQASLRRLDGGGGVIADREAPYSQDAVRGSDCYQAVKPAVPGRGFGMAVRSARNSAPSLALSHWSPPA